MARLEGEQVQVKGADGARRAKRWLESTTRANAQWVNPNAAAVEKLRFTWPHDTNNFTFDLGGILKYDRFDGQFFYAESKAYANSSDLPGHYVDFLAKCYVAFRDRPMFCDHFMWISWSPHTASKWADHTTEASVRSAVLHNRKRVLGVEDTDDADALIDADTVTAVAERLWLIILSDKQEQLVITPEHRGLIEGHEAEKAAS